MRGSVKSVVLVQRDQETEKIDDLDLGANDYVDKPFSIGDLLARIRSHLRRRHAEAGESLQMAFDIGVIHVDIARHEVSRGGTAVHLTPKEFELIVLLARHAGRVLTHRYILGEIWGPAHVDDTQYLRVFIGQLRQKLEDNPAEPRLILTEPGVGYRLSDDAN